MLAVHDVAYNINRRGSIVGLVPTAKVARANAGKKHKERLTTANENDVRAVNLKMSAPYGNRHALDPGKHSSRAVSKDMLQLFADLGDEDDDVKADALLQLSLILDMTDAGEPFEAFCALLRDYNAIESEADAQRQT